MSILRGLSNFPFAIVLCLMASQGLAVAQAPGSAGTPSLETIRQRFARQRADLAEYSVKWEKRCQINVDSQVAEKIDGTTDYLILDTQAASKGAKRFYDQSRRFESGRKDTINGENRAMMAYDGQTTQSYTGYWEPKRTDPNRAIINPGDATEQFAALDDFMTAHGTPMARRELIPGDKSISYDLVATLKEENGYRIESSPEPAADGTPCVVATDQREWIWFDPSLNYAIRQREWRDPKSPQPLIRLRFADHAEALPGLWLARTISCDYFCDPNKYPVPAETAYKTCTIRVAELQVGSISDGLFRLEFAPGTYVEDFSRLSGGEVKEGTPIVSYSIPANPDDLAGVIQEATAARAKAEERGQSGRNFARWVILANVAVAIAAVAYWSASRYRSSPSPT